MASVGYCVTIHLAINIPGCFHDCILFVIQLPSKLRAKRIRAIKATFFLLYMRPRMPVSGSVSWYRLSKVSWFSTGQNCVYSYFSSESFLQNIISCLFKISYRMLNCCIYYTPENSDYTYTSSST